MIRSRVSSPVVSQSIADRFKTSAELSIAASRDAVRSTISWTDPRFVGTDWRCQLVYEATTPSNGDRGIAVLVGASYSLLVSRFPLDFVMERVRVPLIGFLIPSLLIFVLSGISGRKRPLAAEWHHVSQTVD